MHATPARVLKVIVLKMIKEPIGITSPQARVFGYLFQFVGNMKIEEVRRFLRFVTGSSALVFDEISVEFNSLTGINRHPIGHMCASSLQLPTCYTIS